VPLVNRLCASLSIGSSGEVSSDLSSGPGVDLMIVLVNGEGVISLVEVKDFDQVAVATNTAGNTESGETESFNGFLSSGVDFSSLEEFDGFHDWSLSFDIDIIRHNAALVHRPCASLPIGLSPSAKGREEPI
jgi:hypothetical protein